MKPGDLIKIAVLGAGGYLLYVYFAKPELWAQWFGGAEGAGTPGLLQAAGSVIHMVTQTPTGNPAAMKVGDTWAVTITGAPPNQPVTVVATPQSGAPITMTIGTTDASGHLYVSGTATADHIGAWSERWSIGGTQIGMWNFVVSAAGVSGVGAIIAVPNNGPITNPLPPMPSFNGGAVGGGGYGNAYGASKGKGNGYVQ